MNLRAIRPGWYLLVAVVVYALVATLLLRSARTELRRERAAAATPAAPSAPSGVPATADDGGLWFPLPGASLPQDDAHLPGAARPYRNGVSQGFDFYDGDAGIPIVYGTPVVAAAAGEIVRADADYREPDSEAWKRLLSEVAANGADATQLDRLRGRQVWLKIADGRVLRYGHLSGLRDGITEGLQVYRGEVLGYVGNTGTDDGVAGSHAGVRLHFEVWTGADYFGEGLTAEQVRLQAASLFSGP